ncbi:MAG: DUF3576 domain-containing protein [Alphaproteobacteria bacterium]|nr:DUF3576 domain-containing protein [Alphaproteobacteria bacterium]
MGTARFPGKAPIILSLLMAAACGGGEPDYPPVVNPSSPTFQQPEGSVFGPDGLNLSLFGSGDREGGGPGEPGIAVNSFLWRASLDTVSFMPINSADPFGGVILTDWYSPPQTPEERFKLNVYILDRQLRADGIRVAVFRQVRRGGEWTDAEVAEATGRELEDTILTRARQLRVGATTG